MGKFFKGLTQFFKEKQTVSLKTKWHRQVRRGQKLKDILLNEASAVGMWKFFYTLYNL